MGVFGGFYIEFPAEGAWLENRHVPLRLKVHFLYYSYMQIL